MLKATSATFGEVKFLERQCALKYSNESFLSELLVKVNYSDS
jgi:hypothetical protein